MTFPWDIGLGLGLQLAAQIVLFSFFYGRLTQRIYDLEKRVGRIESFADMILRRAVRVDFGDGGKL